MLKRIEVCDRCHVEVATEIDEGTHVLERMVTVELKVLEKYRYCSLVCAWQSLRDYAEDQETWAKGRAK